MNKFIFRFNLVGAIIFCLFAFQGKSQNAPHTTASQVIACPNTGISISITDSNFTGIYSIMLTILYDATVLTYDSTTNIINPALSGAFIGSGVSSGIHNITFSWASTSGVTLLDGTPIFTLGFTYHTGSTTLTFDNTSNEGHLCVYSIYIPNPPYVIDLNDDPTATYYHNGQVSAVPLPPGTPRTWTGSVSTDWGNSNNWNPCGVPVVTEDVEVSGSPPHMPVIGTAGLSCHDILVKNSATLTINTAFTCHNVHMENNGTLHVNPAILMTITGACTIDP
jgi:hypothetical protein